MGFLSGLGNFLVGGVTGGILKPFGSSGNKADPYADLLNQLSPYLNQNKEIANQTGNAGLADTTFARNDFNYVSDYLKKLLNGSDDELLKMLDASGATKNIDENQQMQSELGVRGGRRASILGQSGFDRDAALSNILKQLRFSAPDKIANIASMIGNLGVGELNASMGASGANVNTIFGVEQLRQADKARKAALIQSIFQSIGGVAGTLAAGGG